MRRFCPRVCLFVLAAAAVPAAVAVDVDSLPDIGSPADSVLSRDKEAQIVFYGHLVL